ncbi:hypothetical protein RDI58_024444 [Solanum bulbocastanum]|uniref:Uncharacterized protein n=1 Tax=Solanum bulbocastanum TaxID=147425 RepID=A0AAN8T5X1_SOLBU
MQIKDTSNGFCNHMEEKTDLSSDRFPQLEVLHIHNPIRLSEVTCTDDVNIPKFKKLLLIDSTSKVRLSKHLAKLRV